MHCTKHVQKPLLIGSIPLFNHTENYAVQFSDHLNAHFSDSLENAVLLSADCLLDAADPDSISYPKYWKQYGKRLNLNYLIISCSEPGPNTFSLNITCWQIKPQMQLIFTLTRDIQNFDSLLMMCIEQCGFFASSNASNQILSLPSCNLSDYWKGRMYALFDSSELAVQYFNRALRQSPENPVILLEKADALVYQGQHQLSKKKNAQAIFYEAEELLASVPDTIEFMLKKTMIQARLYICQASWNRAESAIKKIISMDPNQASVYLMISRLHPSRFEKFGFKNRRQIYEKVLTLNPANEAAYLALGDWYYFNNRVKQAESVYMRLLKIYPRSIDGLLALGKLYLYQNESLLLIRTYERVFKLRPKNPDILYNLGIAYYNVHDYQKSLSLFEKAASLYAYPDAYYYIGVIHMKQGNLDKALKAFRNRIYLRTGQNDQFADEAVNHVYRILQKKKRNNDANDEEN